MLVDEATHSVKKGMYRISRCTNEDILVVGSWVDVFVFQFEDGRFVHLL